MYGLSADTSPDLSWHNHLTPVILYVKEKSQSEWLLASKHVAAKTGVAIAKEIVKVLQ